MSNQSEGNQDPQSAKVVKLGLNISVTGDPGTEFEIVLDDKETKALQSSSSKEEQCFELEGSATDAPKHELEKTNTREVTQSTGAIPKQGKLLTVAPSSDLGKVSESGDAENSTPPAETSILSKIKTTMEHFDRFSDHIKEIPRLRNRPLATSTPLSDKHNSKSESSLVYGESRPRKFSHLYDVPIPIRKEYIRSSVRPLPTDVFLKPLPAENYYKRGIYSRFFDYESYRHYGSDISLNKSSEHKSLYGKSSCYDVEKYEGSCLPSETPSGILKKFDSESGDKQSTSSADSIKDIKIYQSGGILIMQNFKENMDVAEKKEMSELSAKLIENCSKLRMEVSNFQEAPGSLSEESKSPGKMVQFDLSCLEGGKSKSGESSSNPVKEESSGRVESSESTSDCVKNKDTSPQGTPQSQDLTSLSTQENDSFLSNPPGTSPPHTSSKKLEWDSGADIGYLNLDLTKENLSTIEKIVLKSLSSDGLSEENIVYEKKQRPNSKTRSKFTVERLPTDLSVVQSNDDSGRKTERRSSADRGSESGDAERKKKTGNAPVGEKGDSRFNLEETKPESSKSSAKEIPKTNEIQPEKKPLEVTDKSVNVNTLFVNGNWQRPTSQDIPDLTEPAEFHSRPTAQRRTSYSPKAKVSKSKTRPSPQQLLRAPKKVGRLSPHRLASYFAMGNPKKVYKKVEACPVLNEAELSREVDEIIIDQRFKIKNVTSGREAGKESDVPGKDKAGNGRESKTKSRPISASSSSNNTVLPKSDNGEHAEEKTKKSLGKVTDQIIQTSDYDRESVGVQAFASQVSSDGGFKSFGKGDPKGRTKVGGVNTSSKNVQAFGLNSSLPKQLEHPLGTEIIDNQNTKSTQFFGGPLNSLPNYHSNLVTKPGESCGRVPNVLKTKRSSEAEIIRMKEENEKNILANDTGKGDPRKANNKENKENLITQKSTNSKRSQSYASGKNSNGNGDSDRRESGVKGKKKSGSAGSSDRCHNDVSSLALTSEALKVHSGDSVDRNIIQEKYFQSQLVELEKREMISRSTSMEIQFQLGRDATGKEYTTTACQYSPQSRGTTSGGREPEEDSFKENSNRKSRPYEEYIRQNEEGLKCTNQDQNAETGDSLPSSTQTAHSWVPGMRHSRENSSGVGKARSFEYLPGHIYESSGNLREELPSETEQNLITSSSSDSDTARGTVSNDGGRDSEGRNTLILENSTESSHGSDDRLKALDRNLDQLNSTVLKLWEKDAQVQSITQSLLGNLFVKSGSGDWLPLGGADTFKTEAGDNKDVAGNGKERVAALSEIVVEAPAEDANEKEFSIACQTEGKSPPSDPEKFYEERKALEKRISEEKKCQIKWIENEIHHLNILRELLERQSSPIQRKKKCSVLSLTSNETSKSGENYKKGISPRAVTPVYGCTISLTENVPPECRGPVSEPNDREVSPQYGLALSLSGCPKNWRRVVMLPVGVQVSMKDPPEDGNDEKTQFRQIEKSPTLQPSRSSAHTQYPSARRASAPLTSASIQTDFPSSAKRNSCTKDNCVCLNLSEKSYSSSSKSKTFERRESSKLHFINEECDTENGNKTSNSTDPEFLEMENYPVSEKSASKKAGEPSDLPESFAKSKLIQSTNYRCQNYPKRVSSTVCKSVCRVPCQSNIYLNYDTTPDEFGTCRCSRIQVQKSANCTCHIIKIHGSKCCSSERSSCSCKRRNSGKKTENQSCQTECDPAATKESIKYREIEKATGALQMNNSHEVKVGVERKETVGEKYSCEPQVPHERVDPCSDQPRGEANAPEENIREEVDPGVMKTSCDCGKRRGERESARVDDHPRHYFLRIEEAEIDDSNEPMQQKKSLEVVTVTVPVKKAGKSKIYSGNIRQTRDTFHYDVNGQSVSGPECKCCSGCVQNQKPTDEYEPRINTDHRRGRTERLESPPTRITGTVKQSECNAYEDVSYYSRVNHVADQQEHYTDRDIYVKPTYPESSVGGNKQLQCCEGCNCINRNTTPSREIQYEYDSHKRRGANLKECHDDSGGNTGLYDERRKFQEANNRARYDGGALRDWSTESRLPRGQEYNAESDRYDPEFYNYNKREFMTRSELLKEEEKKRKAHQPSLQECLSSNRPDFYSSAERRRQIISERAKERVKRHNSRMDCLMKMMQKCNKNEPQPSGSAKRIFTTVEMREQTMRRYKRLPEVTGKIADEKKKEEYRTNRMMADIFAKKLQIEALKGKCCPCYLENL